MDNATTTKSKTKVSRFTSPFIAFVAALGGLLFGYDTGVVSGALLFFKDEFGLSSFEQGIVVSVMQLGAVIGALCCGPISDRYGRRWALAGSAAAFVCGAVLAAVAPSYFWLVMGRIAQGLGVGSAALTVPVYIAEIAPPRIRGALVSLNQFLITVGILLSYVANYLLAPAGAWRWMFGLAAVPAVILLFSLRFLPESPRWLITRGRMTEARSTLAAVSNGHLDLERELADIRESATGESGRWRSLFGRVARPALAIGLILALFQTITGIDTVIYFAPTILHSAGFDAVSSVLSTVGIGVVNVGMTVVSILLLDRIGRRGPLLAGTAVMAIGLVLLGFTFSGSAASQSSLSVLTLMVFVGAFAIGLGPVFWLINAEIYPLRLRAKAAGMATMTIFGSNALVSATFLPLVDALGQAGVFWLYASITVLAVGFIYFRVPETKGRTLEEIEATLRSGTLGPKAR
ncbi:sugar porter family MFS transporter [Saccharopolyspora sp. 5N102]|uniref:sugar porter family MFS transporter n=1 Tax=Saccharopolyspora sp. 5N102 TaxID=3375155 RepID=UPI003787FDE6